MRRELLVPKLGLTMSEGVLVEWMVQPGEAFKAGQGLFVIESEKAANEIGAEADGVLLEAIAQAGQTLPCGTVIGYWDDGQAGEAAPAAAVRAQPAAVPAGAAGGARIPVTPLARRLAARQGVDLAEL
ncbi:biotin/lipoyl-containing protein, partial [Comamonas faecalis]|uniref:biotin/lipoyl-containing protein n=1 Tax=Comamonas faecalis TaxID=1387849 RepID=UPI0031E51D5C